MDHINFIDQYLLESIEIKSKLAKNQAVLLTISNVSNIIIEAYARGNKVILAGNGGSAADAQHIAAEFVSQFFFDRPGLPAIALTTDTSILTAIGNDYGYDKLFSRQLQAQSKEGDVFIGISTSGNSKNVVEAVNVAKECGVTSIVLCGESGALKELADIAICAPSNCTPYIQECHICIGHMICAIVEKQIFSEE
jgi:D-sedoheptulose 7-phosphate isomerase